MSKSYFKGSNNVIIPFSVVNSTINDASSTRLSVSLANGSSLLIATKEKERFLEEYTAWLDSQEQSLI